MKLTVYHNGQYWIGVLEEGTKGRLRVEKYLFGAEPKDNEILEFILNDSIQLLENTSPVTSTAQVESRKINPKRLARQVSKELKQKVISTYAEEAMRKNLGTKKKECQCITREHRLLLKERKRELAAQKKKEKHRGR